MVMAPGVRIASWGESIGRRKSSLSRNGSLIHGDAVKSLACAAALLSGLPAFAAPPDARPCQVGVTRKIDGIIIPRVDLRNVTVTEAIEFVRQKSKQLDPEGVGVNIVLMLPVEPTPAPAQKPR
jgi:hypothetical protein